MEFKKIKNYEKFILYENGEVFSTKINKYLKPRFLPKQQRTIIDLC